MSYYCPMRVRPKKKKKTIIFRLALYDVLPTQITFDGWKEKKKGKNKNLIFSLHHKKKPAASVSPAFPPTDGRFWSYCVLYDV